jgi:hypothetical protein
VDGEPDRSNNFRKQEMGSCGGKKCCSGSCAAYPAPISSNPMKAHSLTYGPSCSRRAKSAEKNKSRRTRIRYIIHGGRAAIAPENHRVRERDAGTASLSPTEIQNKKFYAFVGSETDGVGTSSQKLRGSLERFTQDNAWRFYNIPVFSAPVSEKSCFHR